MSRLLERLDSEKLIGDTPVAEVLDWKNIAPCPEAVSVLDPDRLLEAHRRMVAEGAQIIRTNTLSANAGSLAEINMDSRTNEINWSAVQIACSATRGSGCLIAGSIGPIPPHLKSSASALLRDQMGALLDGGVDLLVFEDFDDPVMLEEALHIKQELHHLPALCLLNVGDHPDPLVKLSKAGAEIVGWTFPNGEALQSAPKLHLPDQFLAAKIGRTPVLPQDRPNQQPQGKDTFAEMCLTLFAANVRLIFGGPGITPSELLPARQAVPRKV